MKRLKELEAQRRVGSEPMSSLSFATVPTPMPNISLILFEGFEQRGPHREDLLALLARVEREELRHLGTHSGEAKMGRTRFESKCKNGRSLV